MSHPPRQGLDLTGGESVYCINEAQLAQAHRLAMEDPESGPIVQEALGYLKDNLTRNQRAALAFVLIEQLLKQEE